MIWSVISAAQVTFDGFPRELDIFAGADYRPPELRLMKYQTPYRPSAAKQKRQSADREKDKPKRP